MKKLWFILFIFSIVILGSGEAASAAADKSSKIEILNWEKVNKLLPKYSTFTVKDVETGVEFQVQRRAGSHHADVQPLTKEDTKKMKKIYDGNWSWKRRAIIVLAKDKKIAASMHGMPHGAGALKNNFPGHFCIHFYGSTTHRTNFMDLSHKLMILKAAGKLDRHIETADPYELLSIYLAGIKQQDEKILLLTSMQSIDWEKPFNIIQNVNIGQMEVLPTEDLTDQLQLSVIVKVEFFITGKGKITYSGPIHMFRSTPYGQWSVDTVSLLNEL